MQKMTDSPAARATCPRALLLRRARAGVCVLLRVLNPAQGRMQHRRLSAPRSSVQQRLLSASRGPLDHVARIRGPLDPAAQRIRWPRRSSHRTAA